MKAASARISHRRAIARAIVVPLAVVASAGCASQGPRERVTQEPIEPAITIDEFISAVDQSHTAMASVTAVRSPVRVEITDTEGDSVRLEGALALRDPGDVRLKLWRQNRDVLDLTRNDGRTFAWLSERFAEQAQSSSDSDQADSTDSSKDRLSAWLDALAWLVEPIEPNEITISLDEHMVPLVFGPGFTSRSVPRTLDVTDPNGMVFTYGLRTGRLLARRSADVKAWEAEFAYAENDRPVGLTLTTKQATVTLTLTDPRWNETLDDALFVPPARAKPLDGVATP